MIIENLISRLEKVKRTGQDRYIACCPAHSDKRPSLAITQIDDRVLIHCFSGCEPSDVLAAVGMELQDLFPERPKPNSKPAKFNPYDILRCLEQEALIVSMAVSDCVRRGIFSQQDFERVSLAHSRIKEAVSLVWGSK